MGQRENFSPKDIEKLNNMYCNQQPDIELLSCTKTGTIKAVPQDEQRQTLNVVT